MRTVSVDPTSGYGSTDQGPTEAFSVAVLDEDTSAALAGSLDTSGGLACVLPRAVATTDGGQVLVSCLGTSEIVAMDATAGNPHQATGARVATGGAGATGSGLLAAHAATRPTTTARAAMRTLMRSDDTGILSGGA
ncbi:MAG TPA: hypothetical protein VGY54_01625, partial [Polyangiaceae bacterium]|nr:hypothetical protein [Polyangiaceae bacterium]